MKLTAIQIDEIKTKYPLQTMRSLASEYNVSLSTIQNALGRKKVYSSEYYKENNKKQYDKRKQEKSEIIVLRKKVQELEEKIKQLKELLND